jgi:hypothetical protein
LEDPLTELSALARAESDPALRTQQERVRGLVAADAQRFLDQRKRTARETLRFGILLCQKQPDAIRAPFFHLAPDWALIPLVGLATVATIIASQAVMWSWRAGHALLASRLAERSIGMTTFLQQIERDPPYRVPGTAVVLTGTNPSLPTRNSVWVWCACTSTTDSCSYRTSRWR